jgi:hypothetical protein
MYPSLMILKGPGYALSSGPFVVVCVKPLDGSALSREMAA